MKTTNYSKVCTACFHEGMVTLIFTRKRKRVSTHRRALHPCNPFAIIPLWCANNSTSKK